MTGPLIVIVGATGTGKSDLSLAVAQAMIASGTRAEIVNADAMQLYRGMDVGTAKLAVDQRRGIPHHMLDVLEPIDDANVAAYQTDARAAIARIQDSGAAAILVGGSGLYVSSVIYDFRFPGTDSTIRARLEADLESVGPAVLHERLERLDPQAAHAIGSTNGRRLVRALEVIDITGAPFGAGLPKEGALWRSCTIVGLQTPRDLLVRRLEERVRDMWGGGILDEARAVSVRGMGVTASRAIGYAQALAQLSGELTQPQAIDETIALTRRYARRQVGWFRRYSAVRWCDSDAPDRDSQALSAIGQD